MTIVLGTLTKGPCMSLHMVQVAARGRQRLTPRGSGDLILSKELSPQNQNHYGFKA